MLNSKDDDDRAGPAYSWESFKDDLWVYWAVIKVFFCKIFDTPTN